MKMVPIGPAGVVTTNRISPSIVVSKRRQMTGQQFKKKQSGVKGQEARNYQSLKWLHVHRFTANLSRIPRDFANL